MLKYVIESKTKILCCMCSWSLFSIFPFKIGFKVFKILKFMPTSPSYHYHLFPGYFPLISSNSLPGMSSALPEFSPNFICLSSHNWGATSFLIFPCLLLTSLIVRSPTALKCKILIDSLHKWSHEFHIVSVLKSLLSNTLGFINHMELLSASILFYIYFIYALIQST